MLIAIFIVLAGCTLYFLLKPPSIAPETEMVIHQKVDVPVYGYEANSNV
ncbi:hypothetical protein [Effusibacillus consociatus]|uniref:Uncharacterized protein n=1 Tax=Effusibacillus consociatus TaxID=1117041 RepID=A0ABV9PWJ7_9BACL